MESNPAPSGPAPVQATVVPAAQPQVVYVQAAQNPFFRWLSWMGWVGCFMAVSAIIGMTAKYNEYFDATAGIEEKFHSGAKSADDKVAIIDISGVIGASDEFVKKQIDRVRKDENVKSIVVRVDSPGGTITGSDYILHHLKELKADRNLPLVVSMGGVAASGGYYVSMAVGDTPNSIYAEPTTTTGSIGVIIPHYDISGLLASFDVKDDSIVSHRRKQLLSMTRPIQPEDREVLDNYLQDAFTRFKNVIKEGRPVFREDPAQLDELATGEIFTANQAKEHGLVDELGFIEDAVARAATLADLQEDSYRVVKYKAPQTLFGAITSARSATGGSNAALFDWQSLLELTVPRAYYLCTF
ncbi:MAG: signal peptide peptidase SppA [Planctomycetales bacterium]|nr:signal peptide peptidase SppA [Planctomycetales bacterium]